jgi:rSAM/selenodomain-associated transferase 1
MEGRHGLRLLDQKGDDIGCRMAGVFEELFEAGHKPVVMVGTDVPAMPSGILLEARDRLATHDVVLGAAEDGGYFLIGLRKPVPELFRDIPWSTGEVRALTLKKAAALGLTVAELSMQRDIDRVEDLIALAQMVPAGKAKGQGGPISMRTAGVLKTLMDRIKERQK